MANHYETLGVHKNETQEGIKDHYRMLSKKYHPDRPDGNAEKFKKLASAYEVLSDPERRKIYDLTGSDVTAAEFDRKAGGLLQQIFQLVVTQNGLAKMPSVDVITVMNEQMNLGMRELEKNIEVARTSRKGIGKVLKKLKHKNKMNPISVMLKHEIQKHTDTITKSKQEQKVGKLAIRMLKEYGYDFDQEEMKAWAPFYGLNRQSHSVVFTGTS
jgi:curved DNA-binding protein CbpA